MSNNIGNLTQKKLIDDYQALKNHCNGDFINVSDKDYPVLKDSLDYMTHYGYITPLGIDNCNAFIKTDAFDLFEDHILAQITEDSMIEKQQYNNNNVFIVHGHDENLLNEVELFIRRIELNPIILKNEPSAGRTVIEKIEDYTDVGFGIVLYTDCDEGRAKKKEKSEDTPEALRNRARQNVVFEHGYLCAKLGRERVVALNYENIEIPSDLAGVVYISYSATDWKNQIMKEMQAAGLNFNWGKA